MKNVKILASKKISNFGEYGTVETQTYINTERNQYPIAYDDFYKDNKHGLYDGFYDTKSYDIHQIIERYEPKKAKGNFLFKAHHYISKDNKKGVLHFFPTFFSGEYETYLHAWSFRLEFDYDSLDGFSCKMMMISPTYGDTLYQDIDVYTFGLLMARFFESCNPHCQYDFKDKFMVIFEISEYEKLNEFAKRSIRAYEIYSNNNKVQMLK